jgi:hypothetical protein
MRIERNAELLELREILAALLKLVRLFLLLGHLLVLVRLTACARPRSSSFVAATAVKKSGTHRRR